MTLPVPFNGLKKCSEEELSASNPTALLFSTRESDSSIVPPERATAPLVLFLMVAPAGAAMPSGARLGGVDHAVLEREQSGGVVFDDAVADQSDAAARRIDTDVVVANERARDVARAIVSAHDTEVGLLDDDIGEYHMRALAHRCSPLAAGEAHVSDVHMVRTVVHKQTEVGAGSLQCRTRLAKQSNFAAVDDDRLGASAGDTNGQTAATVRVRGDDGVDAATRAAIHLSIHGQVQRLQLTNVRLELLDALLQPSDLLIDVRQAKLRPARRQRTLGRQPSHRLPSSLQLQCRDTPGQEASCCVS